MNQQKQNNRIFGEPGWMFYGIIAAICLFVILLFFQGVFKGFFIEDTLPPASELQTLEIDRNEKIYVFDHVAFEDHESTQAVSMDEYSEILSLLHGSSHVQSSDVIANQFERANVARLIIYMKPEVGKFSLNFPYQQVEFIINSGYFRIERPDEENWNYYQLPQAYLKVKQILGL